MNLNYIRFLTGEDDEAYYKRPYIEACFRELNKYFDLNVIDVKLELSDEMINKSSWLNVLLKDQQQNGCTNWLGISDYYRLYTVNQYDNAFYCDTDILFRNSDLARLENSFSTYNEFIIDSCTGNGVYNKYKNNKFYSDFMKCYDEVGEYYLHHSEPFYFNNYMDYTMTLKFLKNKPFNNVSTKNSYHFSLYSNLAYIDKAKVFIVDKSNFIKKDIFNKKIIVYIYKSEIITNISAITLKYRPINNPRKLIYTDNPFDADVILVIQEN